MSSVESNRVPYIGPFVLKNMLSRKKYHHFLKLHVAMRLLLHPHTCRAQNRVALGFLIQYVKGCQKLNGKEYMSFNVHNVVHLANDAMIYGHLDRVSAFPFEKKLGQLKRLLRKAKRSQVVRRIIELQLNGNFQVVNETSGDVETPVLTEDEHSDSPVLHHKGAEIYKKMVLSGYTLTRKQPDNCVILKSNKIIMIKNIIKSDSNIYILGTCFTSVKNLYTIPCDHKGRLDSIFLSSKLDIFKVCNPMSDVIQSFPISDIKCKAVCLPHTECGKKSFAVFPLHVHSND